MAEGTYSAEQVQQLLRCPICLDRFTSPKILPCQHTFCKSPCLEGLIDFRSRKVKCPECRKEHFVPHSGANGFPTNITVSGFLDLPTQASNQEQVEPQPIPSIEENVAAEPAAPTAGTPNKCGVCETEAETVKCFHCNKLVCQSCKRSHTGQMKFDIGRLINQIRRGVPKLSNAIAKVEERSEQSKQLVEGVKGEVNSAVERYAKELREREKLLNSELDTFLQGEMRSLRLQQENLEVELASISSYCDSMESMLNQASMDIPEADMVSMKRQCSEYMEQIRNAENNPLPESRHVTFRFDGSPLQNSIANFGDVCIATPGTATGRNETQRARDSSEDQAGGSRARWSEPHPVDAVYLSGISSNVPPTPELEYLTHREITPRLSSRSPFLEYRPPNQDRTNRSQSSSTDYRPSGILGNQSGTSNGTTPRSWSTSVNWQNYMYRMDTSDDFNDVLNRMREEDNARGRRSVNNSSVFGRDPFSVEERPGGFMTGGGGGGGRASRATPSTTRPAVTRPAASFVVPMGNRRGNRGRRGGSRSQRQAEMRQNAAAAATARAARSAQQQNSTTSTASAESPGGAATANGSSPTANVSRGTDSQGRDQPVASTSTAPNGNNPPPLQRQGTFTRLDGPSNAEISPPQVPNNNNNTNTSNGASSDTSSNGTLQNLDIDADSASIQLSPPTFRAVNDHIENYQQKGEMKLKIGSQRGNRQGKFRCPRGVGVSPVNDNIVIADSSNNRVQIFDQNGQFVSTFGSYGQGDGEFDCLAGVAVNTMGQIIIADRYNHRIQVFDRSGQFSHKFGSEGARDGQLRYPWGVAVDSSGFIYVCDKENNRIQVFQQNGTFVRKFGGLGSNLGQLENPHYVAISHDNKVIVSDTNNHRIQIFNTSGRLLQAFGTEGSSHGRLKHPKGIAVDSQGFIIVADSGNNRVQVHRPNGMFACCFGSQGSGNGQFKGLEGVCLLPNGNILVCEKDNHRVQMF